METLALIIVSLAVALPVVGLAWIYRHHKRLNSINGVFAIIIVAFTVWHYFVCATYPCGAMHDIFTGLFILITSLMNLYCSTGPHLKVNVALNRRVTSTTRSLAPTAERRQIINGHKQ